MLILRVILEKSISKIRMNSKSVKDTLKTVFSLALGVLILWLLYRNTDFRQLWATVKDASIWFLLWPLVFILLGNVIRGLRWGLLINRLGYHPKPASLVYATLGNYAVNFLFPRAGDIWRCAAVTRYDKVPFSKTFETYLIDKILDIVASVVVVAISVVLYLEFFVSYFRENPHYGDNIVGLFGSVWLYVALAGFVILAFVVFKFFREAGIVKKIIKFLKEIKHDLKLVATMRKKKRIIFYTILVWLCFYLYIYMSFYAFGFTKGLGPVAGLIVFAMSNLGVAVPVQGGIGAWHFMVISSLVILGVTYEEASAFALAVFTIQMIWIVLNGVFGILALPYVKRDLSNIPPKESETNQ